MDEGTPFEQKTQAPNFTSRIRVTAFSFAKNLVGVLIEFFSFAI
jgi:hypothetical protein